MDFEQEEKKDELELSEEEILAGRGKVVTVMGKDIELPQIPVHELTNLTIDLMQLAEQPGKMDPTKPVEAVELLAADFRGWLAKALRQSPEFVDTLSLAQIKVLADKLLKMNGHSGGLKSFFGLVWPMVRLALWGTHTPSLPDTSVGESAT